MVFNFADVEMEILVTAEQIYKYRDPGNHNEHSTVFRIQNEDGSVVFRSTMKSLFDTTEIAAGFSYKDDLYRAEYVKEHIFAVKEIEP